MDGEQIDDMDGEQDHTQEAEQADQRAMIRPKRGRPPRPDAELDEVASFEAAAAANLPCKVRVYRRTPRWCSGSIDVYEIDQYVSFEVDAVRRDHGGEIVEMVLIDRGGRIRARLTQRWPDPPRRGAALLSAATEHDAPAAPIAPVAPAPVADPQMKELIALVLSAQERQAKLQADQAAARITWLEAQLRTAQAAPPPPPPPSYFPPPPPPLQPPQAIDLLSQVTKIISEVDGLKAALGATAQSTGETDSIGPLLHDLIKSQLSKPPTAAAPTPPVAPRPPLPTDTAAAAPVAVSDGDSDGDGMNAIITTLKSRLATMPPAKLESILALVLDEGATLEDAPDDATDPTTE